MDIRGLSKSSDPETGPASGRTSVPAPKRRWASRVGLPAVIVFATLALLGYAARDLLVPATPVQVTRAIATPGSGNGMDGDSSGDGAAASNPRPGRIVAQAPGWVEPDPYPVYASALAAGVVQELLVLEGQAVTAGQTIARLVPDDAELALQQAKAELARRAAEHTAAQTDFDNPVALERNVAVNRAMLEQARAQLTRLDAEVASEQAKLREFEAAYDRVARLGADSASRLQVEQADYRAQSQRALVEATRQQRPSLEASVRRYEAELLAAERDLELKVGPTLKLAQATAAVDDAISHVAEAQLRLDRMTVVAPADGVVMNRLVSPGDKVMLGGDMPHAAHVVHLYQPDHLQVRVDVPLADVAKVGVGQHATIVVDVLPDTEFTGIVTRLVHQADISKNTVQIKVAIDDPVALLKPDMLARVKFLGTAPGSSNTTNGQASGDDNATTVAIQQSAVIGGDGDAYVWVVTPGTNRLRQQPVTLGNEREDGWIDVFTGLNPGDAVVASPTPDLTENQRVQIQADQ